MASCVSAWSAESELGILLGVHDFCGVLRCYFFHFFHIFAPLTRLVLDFCFLVRLFLFFFMFKFIMDFLGFAPFWWQSRNGEANVNSCVG